MSDTHIHYDTQYQVYKRQRYDYTAKRWTFVEWMPRGWAPPSPGSNPPQQHHSQVPKTPDRADSAYTGSSPAYSPTFTPGVTQSPGSAAPATPASPTTFGSIQETYSVPYGKQPVHNAHWESNTTSSPYGYPADPAAANYLQTQRTSHQRHQGQYAPHGQQRSLSDHGHALPRGTGSRIVGSSNGKEHELVDKSFRLRPKTFFSEGRVFATIMNETAGENSRNPTDYNSAQSGPRNVDSNLTPVKYKNNLVHTQTRRFVVVRRKKEFAFACPIFTYSGRATLKPGVRSAEHGVVYSISRTPQLLDGETGITKPSIGVRMIAGERDLDIASRIYYGIHHPIQYNVKVKDIGRVPAEHIPTLTANWKEEEQKDEATGDIEEGDESRVPPDSDVDRYLYHPTTNPYGYDATRCPHAYHPIHNPYGYHPALNVHGYHPTSNPFSFHPKHNCYGHHPQKAPFCYHPSFSPHGFNNTANPLGYHPDTAPYNYHPDANIQGYHPTHNPTSFHPTRNPTGVEYGDDDSSSSDSSDGGEDSYVAE